MTERETATENLRQLSEEANRLYVEAMALQREADIAHRKYCAAMDKAWAAQARQDELDWFARTEAKRDAEET